MAGFGAAPIKQEFFQAHLLQGAVDAALQLLLQGAGHQIGGGILLRGWRLGFGQPGRSEHRGYGDQGGGPAESIAPLAAPARFDQAGPPQPQEQLFEHRSWQVLGLGQLLGGAPGFRGQGQFQEGLEGIDPAFFQHHPLALGFLALACLARDFLEFGCTGAAVASRSSTCSRV